MEMTYVQRKCIGGSCITSEEGILRDLLMEYDLRHSQFDALDKRNLTYAELLSGGRQELETTGEFDKASRAITHVVLVPSASLLANEVVKKGATWMATACQILFECAGKVDLQSLDAIRECAACACSSLITEAADQCSRIFDTCLKKESGGDRFDGA